MAEGLSGTGCRNGPILIVICFLFGQPPAVLLLSLVSLLGHYEFPLLRRRWDGVMWSQGLVVFVPRASALSYIYACCYI